METRQLMTMDEVEKDLEQFRLMEKLDEMRQTCEAIIVQDDASMNTALDASIQLAAAVKALEARRKALIEEPDQWVREVNARCRELREGMEKVDAALKQRISEFRLKQLQEKRRQEEENRKAIEAAQKKAERTHKPVAMPAIQPTRELDSNVKVETGSVGLRTFWNYELQDITKVPDAYVLKSLNVQAVRGALAAGLRKIPGLRVFEDVQQTRRPGR